MRFENINQQLYSSDGKPLYRDTCPVCQRPYKEGKPKPWKVSDVFILALKAPDKEKELSTDEILALGAFLTEVEKAKSLDTALEIRSNDKRVLKERISKLFTLEISYQILVLLEGEKNPFKPGAGPESEVKDEPADTNT